MPQLNVTFTCGVTARIPASPRTASMSDPVRPPQRVRVGIIGCGEVAQVIHLPTLIHLSHLFDVRILCDISGVALAHCSARLPHAHRTTDNYSAVCEADDIDVVFVLGNDEYHGHHVITALDGGKHVFVEKPIALCLDHVERIEDAQQQSGKKVMVGYMRRYAAVFRDAIDEIGGAGEVVYARVRGLFFRRTRGEWRLTADRYHCTEPDIRGTVWNIPNQTHGCFRNGHRGAEVRGGTAGTSGAGG